LALSPPSFSLMTPRPPRSPLFPYTTLFRSLPGRLEEHVLRRHHPLLFRPLVRILRAASHLDRSSRSDGIALGVGLLLGFGRGDRIPLRVRFDFGFEGIAHCCLLGFEKNCQ